MTNTVIISVKNGNERRITNTVVLSFNTPQPPQHVTTGYLCIPVAAYIPNTLISYQCQRFGHGRSHCKGQQTCARRGETGRDDSEWQRAEHCVNCNGNCAASLKACYVLLTPPLFNPNFGGVAIAPDRPCWASARAEALSYSAVKLFSKNSNLCVADT